MTVFVFNLLGVVSGGWLVSRLLRVDSGSLVSHISHIAVISVGGVLDVLDPAVGKSHRVRSGNVAGTIGLLLALEVGLAVVVSNGVGEGVGRDLIGVLLGLVSGGGLVGWSGLVSHRGWGIGGSSVDSMGNNRGGVDSVSHRVDGMVSHGVDGMVGNWVDGMVGNWVDGMVGNGVNSVVGNAVDGVVDGGMVDGGNGVMRDHSSLAYWDWSVGSNGGLDLSQTLGVVGLSHRGVGSSESLGLAESSDLTVSCGD